MDGVADLEGVLEGVDDCDGVGVLDDVVVGVGDKHSPSGNIQFVPTSVPPSGQLYTSVAERVFVQVDPERESPVLQL